MIAEFLLLVAAASDPIAGVWTGTSLCQIKPSPCHDEQVVYRIANTGPRRYRIEAYKIVAGKEDEDWVHSTWPSMRAAFTLRAPIAIAAASSIPGFSPFVAIT